MSSSTNSSNHSSSNSSSDEEIHVDPAQLPPLPDPTLHPDLFFMRCAVNFMQVASSYRFEPPLLPKKKRRVVFRDCEGGAERLHRDYFARCPVYGPQFFRRHFRMSRSLFLRIVNALEVDPYFQQRPDACGRFGFSSIQKCTAVIRQLAYDTTADCCDEYLHIGETTALTCLKKFCKVVIHIFSGTYLRRPTTADVQRLTAMHEAKLGFPGMLGSLDCMHWGWKNCLVAWHGAYTRGDQGEPTIILEVVASQDLWIWHAFLGVAGSNNDINELHQSTLFNDVLSSTEAAVHFAANNAHHTRGYYLTDGIYPDWPVFVKSFQFPNDEKKRRFKLMQEAVRKDVERAFGVLQARWGIIKGLSRLWKLEHMSVIMFTCIILHNMIIEDEGEIGATFDGDGSEGSRSLPQTQFNSEAPPEFAAYMARSASLKDSRLHARLCDNLVDHIWAHFGPIDQ
ncbi:protein ALP1-like [Salvia miltiorrhiza]|uniref:protein ALP1-like n=1 Tax=Salvia miltiorrhiza TaxID=226208 RepID=UPI0025ACA46F|nr:protein ALP1-like [Salvia miltiorrhiza]